ncbi:GntR family transcriptional regulator [Streptomyces rubellomurinus]|uniref:GntR family transcriptional regulator n=1 Tax=Streptomyces rubellomurinus (strain ATCC 31215) TaxID=359131 RepID=A0A0F2T9B1_STRR3|nr:GntR family transcriptional regulator [Streptomyces rubellomurinus]KJS58910.1 GntR family transcriptional regulator [Streptomyces rubellomurinus]
MKTSEATRDATREALPLHQRLAAEFQRRIESGEWPEGEPVPSESQLCAEFGSSRGPVRQALAVLRGEGSLVGGRGKPPVARRTAPSQPFATFLSFTQWARGIGREPGQRTIEVARRRATPEAAARLGLPEGEPVVELVRLRLLDGVPAMLERSTFVHEVGRILFDFDPDTGSVYDELLRRDVDLHHARHTIDAVAAEPRDAELLRITAGAPLLRVRRLTTSSRGVPLEDADDRYLPSMATFTIENTVEGRTVIGRYRTEED